MPKRTNKTKLRFLHLAKALLAIGSLLLLAGIIITSAIFLPVVRVELGYQLERAQILTKQAVKPQLPVDPNFGIMIPKIGANAKIIPNVDPYDSRIYQMALTKGVAHAKGTVFPGRAGNSVLFAHSSVNFYEATRYNSVFYLLHKLEKGDEIDVFVDNEKFVYLVTDKRMVNPNEVSYLSGKGNGKTLTLMTCWPPGTTFNRLLILATLKDL